MKKQLLVFIAIIGGVFFLTYCGNVTSSTGTVVTSTVSPIATPPISKDTFQAVEMPKMLANGEAFPLDSNIVEGWVQKSNPNYRGHEQNANIIEHGWALWAALTEKLDTDTTRANVTTKPRPMRRYETWYTPQDVMDATDLGIPLRELSRDRGELVGRKAFAHNVRVGGVVGKSKYNPATADYIFENKLLDKNLATISGMVKPNKITKLVLPNESVIIKPAHWVLTEQHKVKGKDSLYILPNWGGDIYGGTPISLGEYNDVRDGSFIYISTKMEEDKACMGNDTCYSISSFIHHEIDAVEAYFFNRVMKKAEDELNKGQIDTAKAGDMMLLIAMHAATREISKWTWQSFFWSPHPNNPMSPSSATIAAGKKALKPNSLDNGANHYAMTIAYNMVVPAQGEDYPTNFDVSKVKSIYAQNPYIEGPFTRAVFGEQEDLFRKHYPNQFKNYFIKTNVDGVTSNCMSCHSQASLVGNPSFNGLGFMADQYVSRNATWFKGSIQTDFVWSLSGCCENNPDGNGKRSPK